MAWCSTDERTSTLAKEIDLTQKARRRIYFMYFPRG